MLVTSSITPYLNILYPHMGPPTTSGPQAPSPSKSGAGNQTKTFPQIWYSAVNIFEVIKTTFQSSCDWLCVLSVVSSIRRSTRLNYSSPSTTVALENGYLPTTWQESELMFRNNGLLAYIIM